MEKKTGKIDNTCSRCGKAVYFAERKTSLGKNWHPNCLKCMECGKILAPGQHAEHKGMPYCHKPCYSSLFGPNVFGYGQNGAIASNFRKVTEITPSDSSQDDSIDGTKYVFKTTNTSPGPLKLHRGDTPQKRLSSGSIDSQSGSSGYHSNSGASSRSGSGTGLDSVGDNRELGLKCVYQSGGERKSSIVSENQSKKDDVVMRSNGEAGKENSPKRFSLPVKASRIRGAELFKRVQAYNDHNENKRSQALSFTEEGEGNVRVQGPLRIYWGLKKPIMLKQYDEIPSLPSPKKRYSVITDNRDLQPLPEVQKDTGSPLSGRRGSGGLDGSPLSPRRGPGGGGLDDSFLSSTSADVVMRRTNIRKSNTVAYRGDKPNKWKRASINGHIYNYDTSVFTPVLGSCTSVTVDNKMTVEQVIKTLLDKFKVENAPDEYYLHIITEQDGERVLSSSDIPLLERLVIGPSESVKLFIRDRPDASNSTVTSGHIPEGRSASPGPRVEEDTPLPEEVEQLLNIPEPVLQGILRKFKQDEDQDISRLKAKYSRIRKRVQQIISDKKANISRC